MNGVSILSALPGDLFLRYAAAMNTSPHMDDGKPLFASMYRNMVHRVLPTRSDTLVCFGVLVAAKSRIIPVSKQFCRNVAPVYSPPLSARQRPMRPPKAMTVEPTNS